MNTWNITDERVIATIRKHGYLCQAIGENWYLSNCLLTWNKVNVFPDGAAIKSDKTLLVWIERPTQDSPSPEWHDVPEKDW